MSISKTEIKEVFTMLKNRELHPCGEFDEKGRFYLEDSHLVNVREPSKRYPYSQMTAGRTMKFVEAIIAEYKIDNKEDLIRKFNKAKKK